jgi:hypothetical protein
LKLVRVFFLCLGWIRQRMSRRGQAGSTVDQADIRGFVGWTASQSFIRRELPRTRHRGLSTA